MRRVWLVSDATELLERLSAGACAAELPARLLTGHGLRDELEGGALPDGLLIDERLLVPPTRHLVASLHLIDRLMVLTGHPEPGRELAEHLPGGTRYLAQPVSEHQVVGAVRWLHRHTDLPAWGERAPRERIAVG